MNRSFLPSLLSLLFAAALAIACTGGADDAAHQERGPLGKADAVGSCAATSCDGQAPDGNCWCDELCSSYGDCCSDKADACDAPDLSPSLCLSDSACGEGSLCDMSECNMPPCPAGMACPQVCHGLCAPNESATSSIQIGNPMGPIAPDAEIASLAITADVLTIGVTYSGGCEQHDFALFWTGAFQESFPVQAALVLTHEANGDACKALIGEQLSFDLSPLKAAYHGGYHEGAGTINLRVGSLSTDYTFAQGSCQTASGVDFCGGQGSTSCWCDAACEGYGDCCSDKSVVCDAP